MKSLVLWALLLVIGVAVWVLTARLGETPSPAPRFPDGELVDLSHSYGADTIFWPTAEKFRLHKDAEGVTPAGYYYASNSFATSEHGGTHLDAPVHFAQGHQSVDQIPLERFFGPAVVVDVRQQSEGSADYQITVNDLAHSEAEQGAMAKDSIVLLRTGFSSRSIRLHRALAVRWGTRWMYRPVRCRFFGGRREQRRRLSGAHCRADRWPRPTGRSRADGQH